jgi:exonuclease SbcC
LKLKRVKIRGFKGLKEGSGVDEIEVDFTQFSNGLIALAGENGSGKSTFLESCQPFRTLPSHSGSLLNHCFMKDSLREIELDLNGTGYKFIMELNPSTQATSYMIYKGSEPLTKGSAGDYDKELEKIFGSETLFFNSVFLSQGYSFFRRKADRKAFLIELLGLSRYEILHSRTSERVGAGEQELSKVGSALDEVGTLIREQSKQLSEIPEVFQSSVDELESQIPELETKVEDTQRDLSRITMGKDLSEVESAKKELKRKWKAAGAILSNWEDDISEAARIGFTQEAYLDHLKKVEDFLRKLADLQEELREEGTLSSRLQTLEEQIGIHDRSLDRVRKRISELQKTQEIKEEVPCKGMDIHSTCPLLEQARQAGSKIESEEAEIKEIDNKKDAVVEEIESVNVKLQRFPEVHEEVDRLEEEKDSLLGKFPDREMDRGDAVKIFEEFGEKYETDETDFLQYASQLDQMKTEDIQSQVEGLDQLKQDLKLKREKLEAEKQHLLKKKELSDRIEELRSRFEQLGKEQEKEGTSVGEYKILQKAFHPSGIPTYEIECAISQIVDVANELLSTSYEGRFQIDLRTTKLDAKAKKEIDALDIIVIDTVRGTEKEIELLSFGQRVWIQRAIVEAVFLLNRENVLFETSFYDEADGSLDRENRMRFFRMLEGSHSIGNRYHTLFVTHDPFIVESVPQKIEFGEGIKVIV